VVDLQHKIQEQVMLEVQVQVVQIEEMMQVEQELADKVVLVGLLNLIPQVITMTLVVAVVVLAVQEETQIVQVEVQVVQD
jgi:hypothetical protein